MMCAITLHLIHPRVPRMNYSGLIPHTRLVSLIALHTAKHINCIQPAELIFDSHGYQFLQFKCYFAIKKVHIIIVLESCHIFSSYFSNLSTYYCDVTGMPQKKFTPFVNNSNNFRFVSCASVKGLYPAWDVGNKRRVRLSRQPPKPSFFSFLLMLNLFTSVQLNDTLFTQQSAQFIDVIQLKLLLQSNLYCLLFSSWTRFSKKKSIAVLSNTTGNWM